jgi:spore coat protein U-like protein
MKKSRVLILLIGCIWSLLLPGRSLGATAALGVSATIPSWGYCGFQSNSATLDFGNLDPANPTDVNANATLSFRCLGWPTVTFYISHDSGLHGAGPNALRLANTTLSGAYIPYSISLTPTSGTIPTPIISAVQTLTISGTIHGADYQTAYPGTYSDTVVLTIVP